jgi:hypothetical protein
MKGAAYHAEYYRRNREKRIAQVRAARLRRLGQTRFDHETKTINDLMRSWKRV